CLVSPVAKRRQAGRPLAAGRRAAAGAEAAGARLGRAAVRARHQPASLRQGRGEARPQDGARDRGRADPGRCAGTGHLDRPADRATPGMNREATPAELESAVSALAAGAVVGLPTETVYGLAADAANAAAIAEVYRIKGRPTDHPLIVHVLDAQAARRWARWSDAAERLAVAFWPGPLTIVLERLEDAPAWACAGHQTIALRAPSHPVARSVMSRLAQVGITGLAAPSANRFGRVSP